MVSVAIYVRLSEEDRNKTNKEQDSESIINQRSILSEYANDRSWDIYEIYSDEDYSGSDSTRPAFNKMIKDAEDKKFNVVLCKSLSRFARDVAVVETYINGYFLDWGIRFISVSDYADSSQKGNRKNIQINSLVNQWYLEDLSENIKSVMTHKKKQGQFVGSFAPYGYIKAPEDSHKLIIDEEAATVVRRIYKLYLEGYGNKAIANFLNNENIPCPSKYRKINGIETNRTDNKADELRWSDHTIWHITRNPTYTGDLSQCRYGKPTYKSKSIKEKAESEWITVENTHEAIVSKEDYNLVQTHKKNRSRHYRYKDEQKEIQIPNVFAGLIKCKICGRSLTLSGSGLHNQNANYLRCAGRKTGVVLCTCAMVKYSLLLDSITEKIQNLITRYADFDTLEKQTRRKDNLYNSEINNLQKSKEKNLSEQKKIDDALSNSYIDKSSGNISDEEFTIISKNLRERKTEIRDSYNLIQERLTKLCEIRDTEVIANTLIEKYKNFTELNREIANAFIDVIYIGERDKTTKEVDIIIHWKI